MSNKKRDLTKPKAVKINRLNSDKAYVDYWSQLSPEEIEFLNRFNAEWADNGHSREGSLHREILGSKYDVEEYDKDDEGNPRTMKSSMFHDEYHSKNDVLRISTFARMTDSLDEKIEEKIGTKSEIEHREICVTKKKKKIKKAEEF